MSCSIARFFFLEFYRDRFDNDSCRLSPSATVQKLKRGSFIGKGSYLVSRRESVVRLTLRYSMIPLVANWPIGTTISPIMVRGPWFIMFILAYFHII